MYGVEPDSKYIKADLGDGVYISTAYADKYQVEPGDKITLKEKYERKRYTFKVKGVYDYSGAISVFMSRDKLNETFDLEVIIIRDILQIQRLKTLMRNT